MKHLVLFATLIYSVRVGVTLEPSLLENSIVPSEILVAVGESVFIKVKNHVESQTSCTYKAPGKKEINSFDSSVKFSDDECGIRIEKVQQHHVGVWKLVLHYKNETHEGLIRGTSVIGVREPILIGKPNDQIISSSGSFAPDGYDLSYCYVSRTVGSTKMAEIESSTCRIPQDIHNEFREGTWNVRMGIEGVSEEISFTVNVQSTDETIETVVKRDNNVAQLLCRVRNMKNVLNYCRFERLGEDNFGLHLEDGIGTNNYRYYGQGITNGECGLQISNLDAIDKTQWKCYLGLMNATDAGSSVPVKDKTTFKYSAVLDASDDWYKLKIISDNSEIYLVDNQSAVIQCNANNAFDFCWIQNSAGKIISLSDKKELNGDDEYQYYGDGFNLGQCGVKIKLLTHADAGEWKCGVGRVTESMKEAVEAIKVEVKSSSMMAITKRIEDFSGNSIVIQCRAIPIGTSLSSCHFLMPNGEAFSINEKVTKDEAIDGIFYYDPNRKLSDGYCTVVIAQLNKNVHAGKWICGGKILGRFEENYDEIYVIVDSLRGASLSIITLSTVLPLIAVLALLAFGYKKYRQRQQARFPDNASVNTAASNDSNSSGGSMVEMTAVRSVSHSC